MRATTAEIRTALEDVYDTLTGSPTGTSLRTALRTKATAARATAAAIAGIASTSGNGKSTTFATSGDAFTAIRDEVTKWADLVSLLDQIVADGTLAIGGTALTFKTEMLARIGFGHFESTPDFTEILTGEFEEGPLT